MKEGSFLADGAGSRLPSARNAPDAWCCQAPNKRTGVLWYRTSASAHRLRHFHMVFPNRQWFSHSASCADAILEWLLRCLQHSAPLLSCQRRSTRVLPCQHGASPSASSRADAVPHSTAHLRSLSCRFDTLRRLPTRCRSTQHFT